MSDSLDTVFVSGKEARMLELKRYLDNMPEDKRMTLKELIEESIEYRMKKAAPDAQRERLRDAVIEAARKECAKFNFPDEDRPGLWDALQSLDELTHPDGKAATK